MVFPRLDGRTSGDHRVEGDGAFDRSALSLWHRIEEGQPLDALGPFCREQIARADAAGNRAVREVLTHVHHLIVRLEGGTPRFAGANGDAGAVEQSLGIIAAAGHPAGVAFARLMRQVGAYVFGRYDEADREGQAALGLRPAIAGSRVEATQAYFSGLIAAARYPTAPAHEQAHLRTTIAGAIATLHGLRDGAPAYFACRHALLLAEQARINGWDVPAMRHYEQAIEASRAGGFVAHESLACERAGIYYDGLGLPSHAATYLEAASAGYTRWGAHGLVRRLIERWPTLAVQTDGVPDSGVGRRAASSLLDLPDVIKASQAVSSEMVLDRLIEKLLGIVLVLAGAQRALLLQPRLGEIRIEAEATSAREIVDVRVVHLAASAEFLPESVVRYVVRTCETVIVDDATASDLFASDDYVKRHRVRSVLCLPLRKRDEVVAVLYLENNLTSGAFTKDRIAILEVLASQAAISLENARLFADLNEERGRLQAVIQRVPAGLVIADAASRRVVAVNDQASAILQPLGPITRADGWPLDRSLSHGEVIAGEEIELSRADGTRGWISLSSTPVKDTEGRITGGVAILQDITDRKEKEEALRVSEERFSKAFHNNPTPMVVISTVTWNFVDANDAFALLLGLPRAEILRQPIAASGAWLLAPLQQSNEMVSAGLVFHNQEISAIIKPGDVRHLLVSSEGIRFGNEDGLLATFVDLTERKRIDEQLRQSLKMDAIGNLAGGVAHDFNNLLTAINGYSELLLHSLDPEHPHHGFAKAIHTAGERAAGLTRKLLAFSRLETVQARVLDLNALVGDMEGMLRRLIEEDAQLATRLSPDIASIRADPTEVEQILVNLVLNARDAMPEGGRVRVETSGVEAVGEEGETILRPVAGPLVVLSVTDNGMGMSPETCSKIFEPFFTTKEVGKGTGLGLAVVYGIVKKMGGGLSVASEPGRRTTFHVYFPVSPPVEGAAAS
jgi:PAS domain S-box-containing protein